MTGEKPHTQGEAVTKEIERKWLVDELPVWFSLQDVKPEKIEMIAQGYLAVDGRGAVRIRQKGEKYFLTYKSVPGVHAAERDELETELSADQFNKLWPGTEGRRVEKTRYVFDHPEGLKIELDIFEGANAGRMLAEIEFTSTDLADSFEAPAWFGLDVTTDKRYGNSSIADNGFPAIVA